MVCPALLCFYSISRHIPCIFLKEKSHVALICPTGIITGKVYKGIYILNHVNDFAILRQEIVHSKRIPSLAGYWINAQKFFRIILKSGETKLF
jgi:hypothetical protein